MNSKELTNSNAEDIYSIFEQCLEIYKERNLKYGNSFDRSMDKYGEIAALVRLGDKFNRLDSLVKLESDGNVGESKTDTYLDIINYCAMTIRYMNESKEG
jgi:hypothetical protein